MTPSAAPTCWANNLSPCGDTDAPPEDADESSQAFATPARFARFSLDHVSLGGRALFPNDAPPISEQFSRSLCAKHRSLTSHLDQSLIDLGNSVREVERLRSVRQNLKTEWHQTTRFVLDGARIERCILKWVLHSASAASDAFGGWQPPPFLSQVVFGQAELASGCGLSLLARLGDSVSDTERRSLTFGVSEHDHFPVGVIFELRKGWRFLCTWDRRAEELREIRFDQEQYLPGADDVFHAKHIAFTRNKRSLGLSLDFDWSGNWSPTKNRNVVALRETSH